MTRFTHLLLMLVCMLPMSATQNNKQLIDSIRRELRGVTTAVDSLPMYYDIFDLLSRARQVNMADTLYEIARRAGNEKAQLDMLRTLTSYHTMDDSLRYEYQKRVEKMTPSSEQRLTLLFIKVNNSVQAARYPNAYKNTQRLKDLVERTRRERGASLFTRLEVTMTLCAFFDDYSQRSMLRRYLERAKLLMDRLPESTHSLKNMLISQSAINYAMVGDLRASVKEDLKLLGMMDSLEEAYHQSGRKYRNYNYNRYVSYRRMLSNYAVLTPEEVENYYELCKHYASIAPTAKRDMEESGRPTIYYMMAKKQYADVIPMLRKEIHSQAVHEMASTRRKMVNALIEAATAVGDREALFDALQEYRNMNEDMSLHHDPEEYVEMQFVYETNTLNLDRSQMEIERQMSERDLQRRSRKSDRIAIASALIVILILGIVVIFMMRTSRRMKQLNARSAKDNAALTEERDTLRRTQRDLMRASENARIAEQQREEFVNNVSNEIQTPVNAIVEYSKLIVDCIDDDRHKYLERFASVVNLNAELLMTLVSDVLEVASHDKGSMKIEKRPVAVNDICTVAIDTIKERLQPGVEIINEIDNREHIIVDTDAKRVAQVLMNLLGNAVKFTEEGTVTLDGGLTDDGTQYRFTVTDTGIGIPEGKEEEIFERFKKLSKYTQGVGLGLPVSRMIAELLGGTVKVDTSYKGRGARFIFTISVK